MDAFLPSVLDSTVDILENSDLALNGCSSDLESSEVPITSNVDLCLECEEDGGSISMQPCSDFYLSHEFIGENIQLAISFPDPGDECDYGSDKFPCSVCNSAFRKQNLLFKHLQETHNVRQSYSCDICSYATTSSKLLSRHRIRKHGLSKAKKSTLVIADSEMPITKPASLYAERFENVTAGKRAAGSGSIIDKTVEDGMIVSSNVSDDRRSITYNCNIQSHTHPSDKGNISEPGTHNKSNMIEEIVSDAVDSEGQTILQSSSFQCTKCSYTSKSKRLLKYHTDSMHNPERKLFTCVHCSYTCRQKRTLDLHTAKQHTGGDPSTCSHCQKIFFSPSALRRHFAVHIEDKQFVCSVNSCLKAFKTAGALGDHKRKVHSVAIRPNLNGHGMDSDSIKNNTKKVVCGFPGCGKSFRDKTNLRTHQCVHSGERPLSCSLCPFRCVQKTSLDYHNKKCHSV